MSRKNALLTALLVVVIVGGFMLWSKEESNSSLGDEGTEGSYASSDDSAYVEAPNTPGALTKKTTTTGGTKSAVPSPTSVPAPTRVLENGQYISIVSLTNSGFVPQAVTIVKGESVRFVNRSGYAMRIISTVASAEYSGLNQEKSVGSGGTYSLNFPKSGTYAFGNGKASAFIGVVNVQ